MVFKLKYIKGIMPCKYCKIGSHTRCYKLEHCSCNCPFEVQWKGRTNQNRKKTCCSRGHEFTPENTRVYLTPNGSQHRVCHQCQVIRRELNIEKIRINARKSYHKNKYVRKILRKIQGSRYTERIKREVLTYYGNGKLACVCCRENIYEFLTIDHMNNNGSQERKIVRRTGHNLYRYLIKSKFPFGYQTLCFNCNSGKQINKGMCPHKIFNTIPVFIKDIKITTLVNKAKEGEGQFLN